MKNLPFDLDEINVEKRIQRLEAEAREQYKEEHGHYPEEDGIAISINI
jgi:hypothetical protein